MIVFAKSENGNMVSAAQAKPGVKYFCQHCGAPLFLRISKNGIAHFVCYPGHQHTAKECVKLEISKTAKVTDLSYGEKIHRYLQEELGKAPVGKGGAGVPRTPAVKEERLGEMKSLEDIWNLGDVTDMDFALADGPLTDLYISSGLSAEIMKHNEALGYRALELKPDFFFVKTQCIRFVMKSLNGNFKVLDYYIPKAEDFWRIVKRLFLVKGLYPHKSVTPRYRSVLVYGKWEALSKAACRQRCQKSCTRYGICSGLQQACYQSSRQIFFPSSGRVEEKTNQKEVMDHV